METRPDLSGYSASLLKVQFFKATLLRLALARSVNFYFTDESEPSLVIARVLVENLPGA
jgi:hypothetical protein